MLTDLPEPWRRFLEDVDALVANDPELNEPIDLHCLGGFVFAMCYGLQRPTGDLDVFEIIPARALRPLIAKAGKGSKLAETHGLYLDVGVGSQQFRQTTSIDSSNSSRARSDA